MKTHISIDSKPIEFQVIEIQSRSMLDPTLSDINFKQWLGSGLPLNPIVTIFTLAYTLFSPILPFDLPLNPILAYNNVVAAIANTSYI